ncbi:MAG: NAD-dependent epimerase/dehydratase family protein [bacterium]|nr:NAD-dependent epimerase/dehydratase family protein [bacterium]
MNTNTNILVTGSSGFIGSHLVTALIKKGCRVSALVRASTDTQWLDTQPLNLVKGDYSDMEALEKAVTGMEYVFHVGAALKAPDYETFHRANATATGNLLEACVKSCPGLKRFVHVSSISAAGPSRKDYLKTEEDECNPVSLYGKSKLAAEQLVNDFSKKLPVVIVRPPNVLGYGQSELRTLIKLAQKRVLPILGNGDKQTSICFVEDVVDSLILAAEKSEALGKIYFVTDNNQYSWRELVVGIAEELGVMPFVLKLPYPALYMIAIVAKGVAKLTNSSPLISISDVENARQYYWIFSSEKIEKELGFRPAIHFKEGIADIISRYRQR